MPRRENECELSSGMLASLDPPWALGSLARVLGARQRAGRGKEGREEGERGGASPKLGHCNGMHGRADLNQAPVRAPLPSIAGQAARSHLWPSWPVVALPDLPFANASSSLCSFPVIVSPSSPSHTKPPNPRQPQQRAARTHPRTNNIRTGTKDRSAPPHPPQPPPLQPATATA
jgi:hypothetical protein